MDKIIYITAAIFTVLCAAMVSSELVIYGDMKDNRVINLEDNPETIVEAYGEMYIFDEGGTGHTVVIGATDTYYNVTEFESMRRKNMGFEYNNSLVIKTGGLYFIDYSFSFSGGGSQLYGITLSVNNLIQNSTYIHRKMGTGGDVGNGGGTGILRLKAGDRVNLQMEDETDPVGNDATVEMANVRVVKL